MNSTLQAVLAKAQTMAGGMLAFAFGVYDAGWLHAFSKDLDLACLLGGLAVLGVTVAYQKGASSAAPPTA